MRLDESCCTLAGAAGVCGGPLGLAPGKGAVPERAPDGAPGGVPEFGRVAAPLRDHMAHGARLARALGRHLPPVSRQAPTHQNALTSRDPRRPPRRAPP